MSVVLKLFLVWVVELNFIDFLKVGRLLDLFEIELDLKVLVVVGMEKVVLKFLLDDNFEDFCLKLFVLILLFGVDLENLFLNLLLFDLVLFVLNLVFIVVVLKVEFLLKFLVLDWNLVFVIFFLNFLDDILKLLFVDLVLKFLLLLVDLNVDEIDLKVFDFVGVLNIVDFDFNVGFLGFLKVVLEFWLKGEVRDDVLSNICWDWFDVCVLNDDLNGDEGFLNGFDIVWF